MYCHIAKSVLNDHLGSSNDPCYIQNRVILNHVIKRLRCTKFRGNWSTDSDSGEGFLQYMGVEAILVMWPRCCEQTQDAAHKIWLWTVLEMFEIVDDGRRSMGILKAHQ